jgi:OFA family oxalate/formate antiporter-like MFS transporter
MFGTGLAIQFGLPWLVYLSYGCIMGIGLGIGYLTPVKTLMMWFSEHKGLATGIAITGFGLAKVIASPIIEHLLQVTTVFNMFYILGIIYLICMIIGTLLIKKPYADKNIKLEKISLNDMKDIILNKTYLAIWFVFFINITCGLAIISQEKNILLSFDNLGLSISAIAMLTAAANSFGRFAYSTFSDYISNRGVVYELIFVTSMLFAIPAIFSNNTGMGLLIIVIMMLFINMGYGGGFSTLPSLLSDKFGMRNVSIIHGFALSAWAWAGLVGNQIGSYIITNYDYNTLYIVLIILYSTALIINHKLILPLNQK